MLKTILPVQAVGATHAALVIGSTATCDDTDYEERHSFPSLSPSNSPQGAMWMITHKGAGAGDCGIAIHHVDFLSQPGTLQLGGLLWTNDFSGENLGWNVLFHPDPAVTSDPGADGVVNLVLPSAFIITATRASLPTPTFGITLATC